MSLLGEESAGEFYLLGLLCYGLLTQEVSSWKCCACEVRWIVFAAPLGFNFSLVSFAQVKFIGEFAQVLLTAACFLAIRGLF